MNGKLTNRKKQAIETRNRIYSTALDLMYCHGLDNVTVEDICKEAGVAIGSFYHYFKSKNDIYFEIYKRADEYFENTVYPELIDDDSIELIKKFFLYYAKYNLISGIEIVKMLYNANNKQFISKDRYMLKLFNDIIIKGQEDGSIVKEYESSYIVDFFFITVRGVVYDWCVHDGDYNLESRIKEYIDKLVLIFKV